MPNSLESFNFPNHFMRHQGLRGRIDLNDGSSLFQKDASFELCPGLANNSLISFESVNFPGHFLRHRNFEMWLDKIDNTDLFRKDATFHQRPGLSAISSVSFESFNFPNHFIRHQNFLLRIDLNDSTDLYQKDSTFHLRSTLHVPAPLTSDRSDNIEGGTMQTNITLARSGQLTGITRTFTKVNFKGFTGAVQVVLFTHDGRSFVSQKHPFGVDGDMVPGGRDDRTDTWTETVPQDIASKVIDCAILQYHDPKFDVGHWIRKSFDELKSELGPIIVAMVLS